MVEALEGRALLAVAGSLDSSFGGGYGFATAPLDVPVASVVSDGTFPFEYGYSASADSVNALPGGNILVTGTVLTYNGALGTAAALSVEELNAEGSLDTSFGTNGRVQVPIIVTQGSSFIDAATVQSFQVSVQPSGQILLASATIATSGNSTTYYVARLNADGSLDTTFGTGGVAEYPAAATTPVADRIQHVATALLQSDGKIVLAGDSYAGFSAVRLNTDGSLDTTYGTDGTVTVPVTLNTLTMNTAVSAAIQSDDQVVLAGTAATGEIFGGQ